MFSSIMVLEYTRVFFKCNYMFRCGILLLQEIKKNLPKSDLIMIEEGISIHDVGFITFSLSREWMAKVFFFLFFSCSQLCT